MGFLDSISKAADSIKKGAEEAVSGLQNTAKNAADAVQNAANNAASSAHKAVQNAASSVQNTAQGSPADRLVPPFFERILSSSDRARFFISGPLR